MFASTVRALHAVRAEAAAVKARRAEVFDLIKAHYENGDVFEDDSGRVLRKTPDVPQQRFSVNSKAVERQFPALWRQSRVPKPYVQCKAPVGYPAPCLRLPAVPDGKDLAQTVAVYESFGPRTAELRESETSLVERLRKIGADNGWDGMPIKFADGWQVSLARMEFSGDRMAELDPERWRMMATAVTTAKAGHVVVSKVSRRGAVDLADEDRDDDVDEGE